MKRLTRSVWIPLLTLALPVSNAWGQGSLASQVEAAAQMLPPEARWGLTLLARTPDGTRVDREGSGPFACLGDLPGDDRFSVSCFNTSLSGFLERQRELVRSGLRGGAMRDQLCRDVASGKVSVPGRGLLIEASGPMRPGGALPDSVTVYHLLQLPGANAESLGLPPREVRPGWPWLHHSGTCDAHVMWSERRAMPGSYR